MANDYDSGDWEGDVNDHAKPLGDEVIRRMQPGFGDFNRDNHFRSQHVAGKYEPRWEKEIERHPDKRPSENLYDIENDNKTHGERIVMQVRGLGAIVLKKFKHPSSGVVMWKMSTATDEEIQFD